MLLRVIAASFVGALLCAAPAGAAGSQRFFFSTAPARASCELDVGVPGLPSAAYCLVGPPQVRVAKAVSVGLSPSGRLTVCHGLQCIGNAPEHTPTLAAGHSIVLGPFRCTSLSAGVRCVVQRSGHGFVLGLRGVTKV